MSNLHGFINRLWYNPSRLQRCLSLLMLPLAWLLQRLASRARTRQLRQLQALPLPVIVVGNINIGGTGKTPLIIALAQFLRVQGYRPGVVSRGYGGHSNTYPLLLNQHTPVATSGDEPAFIFQALNKCAGGGAEAGDGGVAVCVDPDRTAAARHLHTQGCNVILSDDGLQHYKLSRDIELVVVDAARQFGNGRTLPAGPLREPVSRLQTVDAVITNGYCEAVFHASQYEMRLEPLYWVALAPSGGRVPLSELFLHGSVQAISGIGNPQRFFDTLRCLNIVAQTQAFADHYDFGPEDLRVFSGQVLLMTAKDAIKCHRYIETLDTSRWYYLEVEAILPEAFFDKITERLQMLVVR